MQDIIYERYCKLRDSASFKDSDVSKGTGITKSTFSDWKTGRYVPKQSKMQKIADFFGVSLDYLLTGDEIESPDYSNLPKHTKENFNFLISNPEWEMILDIAKDISKEDIEVIKTVLEKFKKND